jgi:fimbrial chaperone protein
MKTLPIPFPLRSLAALLCLTAGIASPVHAGIVVGATRVICDEAAREASVSIKDADTAPFVVQAWIDTGTARGKAPFFITPPLSRLDPGKQNVLRVMRTNQELPADRESMYGLNVKEIPETPADKNVLQIAVRTRIKLFYRPAGLLGRPSEAQARLEWHVDAAPNGKGGTLTVHNPTPYYVTFATLHAGSAPADAVDIEYVAPFGDAQHPIAQPVGHTPLKITFSTINDFGAITEPVSAQAAP